MRLADHETTVRLDGRTFHLRPTLRAAFRLERRYGLPALMKAIRDGNVTTIADVLAETSGQMVTVDSLLPGEGTGLDRVLALVTPALVATVLALAGVDPDADTAPDDDNEKADPVPFAEHFERLFRIATGWLGWTPAEAWNATLAEITAAYEGRVELLKAIFGSDDKPKDARSLGEKTADFFLSRPDLFPDFPAG